MTEPVGRGSRWQRAVVTGASSGIGEAFADQLASTGVDLILVGRNVAALDAVAARARMKDVHAETLPADLAVDADVARVVSKVLESDPMVDLLVNNAGIGQFGGFVDLSLEEAIDVMHVNNDALVRLTHAAATRMVAAGHGTIIQVSSTASASPGPAQAVYAATKAFVSSFGQALSDELAATGVTCTTVLPGYTRTRYFERVGLSVHIPEKYWMSAEDVARAALDGAAERRPLVIPGLHNRWGIAKATSFPSLAKGRAVRRLGQARRLAYRATVGLVKWPGGAHPSG
jgi:short-subunit dehydrogenase